MKLGKWCDILNDVYFIWSQWQTNNLKYCLLKVKNNSKWTNCLWGNTVKPIYKGPNFMVWELIQLNIALNGCIQSHLYSLLFNRIIVLTDIHIQKFVWLYFFLKGSQKRTYLSQSYNGNYCNLFVSYKETR